MQSDSSSLSEAVLPSSPQDNFPAYQTCSTWVLDLTTEEPVFEPKRVKHAALDEYRALLHKPKGATDSAGSNTAEVDPSDLMRAEANIVAMLPRASDGGGTGLEHGAVVACTPETGLQRAEALSRDVYNVLRNFAQEKALDARPIVTDFGCVIGRTFAAMHFNATVLCLVDRQLSSQRLKRLDLMDDPALQPHRQPNLLWLNAPQGFLVEPFSQLYSACNFVTIGFVLFALHSRQDPNEVFGEVIVLLRNVVPSTAVVIAAVPAVRSLVEPTSGSDACRELITVLGASPSFVETNALVSCQKIGQIRMGDAHDGERRAVGASILFRLELLSSRRLCRKTWGAPLVQWDRSQTVTFNAGTVTFRVDHVKKDASASTTMRTIHPLQYVHSVNLDTLLGAGLDVALRRDFLGQMITSPRYSDPLPHNWVVAGGGRLERIDKVDLRYDRDVDESKGYWGHSTLGYLHLFAHHLCLDVAPTGLPAVAETPPCRPQCRTCAATCSYLPKASEPCAACLACGQCIRLAAATPAEASRQELEGSVKCQKTYSSMHAARRVWKGWEKSDKKHPF